jgi:MFS family permease
MTEGGPESFRVSSLARSVYIPNLLFSIGQGAAIPVIALLALELGASPAVAGVVVALRGVGTMISDIPAGILVARIGERRAMILAGAMLTVVSVGIWLAPSLGLYAVLVTLMGCTWSVWLLARIAFATGSSPVGYRGRVMSMIGGVHRIGLLIGPLLGSLVITRGGLGDAFLVLAALAAAASVTMAAARSTEFTPEPTDGPEGRVTVVGVIRDHRRTLSTAGSVAVITQVLRSSREALIPLWGDHLGITPATIPLVFAASAAVESLFFYPVGMVMDRKGRKWAAVPATALLSLGIAAIPITSDLASLTVVALVMGLANGLGSGMNMTLGSDLSPLAGRSRFLGVWRLVSDLGTVGGPLLVAVTTSVATLGAAALMVGGVGAAGVLVLWRLVPETLGREVPGG